MGPAFRSSPAHEPAAIITGRRALRAGRMCRANPEFLLAFDMPPALDLTMVSIVGRVDSYSRKGPGLDKFHGHPVTRNCTGPGRAWSSLQAPAVPTSVSRQLRGLARRLNEFEAVMQLLAPAAVQVSTAGARCGKPCEATREESALDIPAQFQADAATEDPGPRQNSSVLSREQWTLQAPEVDVQG